MNSKLWNIQTVKYYSVLKKKCAIMKRHVENLNTNHF